MSKARVVVSKIISKQMSVTEAAATYGVSRQHIHRWLARYRDHGFDGLKPRSRRPHSNPQRTDSAVAERIVVLRRELAGQGLDHGPQTIGWHLEQEQLPVPSTSTIRRILVAAGLVTAEPRKRPKSSYRRFEADQPNECWQSDFTHWQLADGSVVEIINWLDDHSRYLLAAVARPRISGEDVVTTFLAAADAHGLPHSTLTDIQAWWCPEVPGLSGRRCEDRWVRHPPIVVASPIGARRDSLPVDHVGVRGLLPETGHPVRNLATAPNSPRIPVSECLVRLVLVRQWAVDGS